MQKKTLFPIALCAIIASTCLAEPIVLYPLEGKINGRVQYQAIPGSGDGSLKLVDEPLPAQSVRVGPTGNPGIGLGYLLAFPTTEDAREALFLGEPAVLELAITGASNGGTPSDVKVAFLHAGGNPETQWIQFRAWNPGWDFAEISSIPAQTLPGSLQIDIQGVLDVTREPLSSENNLIWFALYVKEDDLTKENSGRHLIFSGEGAERPRLIIGE